MVDRRGEFTVAVIWFALALWVYSVAADMPVLPRQPTQPGQWPAILALIMTALSLGLLVQLALRWRASKRPSLSETPASEAESPLPAETAVETRRPVNFFLSIALLVVYIWLLPRLGFWLVTPLLLAAYMLLLGLRKPLWLLVLTFGIAAVVVVVFSQVLAVPLPRGVGVFRDISYRLY